MKDRETKKSHEVEEAASQGGGNLSPALFIMLLGHSAISWGAEESG